MNIKKNLKFFLLTIIFFILIIINFIIKTELILLLYKNYRLSKLSIYFKKEHNLLFNLTNLIYFYNYKYNIVQINYNIVFFDENNNIIKPSDLTLFNGIQIICHMKSKNTEIDSLAYILKNKEYNCIDFIDIKEKAKFGIKIFIENNKNFKIYFFSDNIINYNKKNENKNLNPLLLNIQYQKLIEKIKNNKNNSFSLKKLYIESPTYLKKGDILFKNNIWYFKNIYNNYFCFCKGSCFYLNISQKCKYLFYLNIIDNNKNLYKKTDYLFSDFYFEEKSSDDTYPIFSEMIKQNLSAHYMDEKRYLYEKFCYKQKNCLNIIPVINRNRNIDGDFLEKYLDLILRLKAVIVGDQFYSFDNIFYNIDYITYINLGHGVKFFKHYLYRNYSSYKKYNKILLPPSSKLISLAKNYGWTDENIIKICLPKWDKYDSYRKELILNHTLNNQKYIFAMFTWRNLRDNKYNISLFYFKGIIELINNYLLNEMLQKNNIIFYFNLHPNLQIYRNKIKTNKFIKFIFDFEISDCLTKSNLLISDFSSIIFDMIYQNKPYIMYIPDAFDSNIKYIYDDGYYDIIQSLINNTYHFKNKFFKINETINKIIYYINNNFTLELDLKNFYDSFELKCQNNTKKFIKYLENIK